jgi:hypothetical protein
MTWVGVAISLGVAAAGAGVSMYEQGQVAKKQDNILAQEMQQQMASEKRNAAATQAMIAAQKKQPQANQGVKSAAEQEFNQALKANQSTAQVPLDAMGNVSKAYQKAKADAALGAADQTAQFGDLTAAISAPTRARQADRRSLADYGIGMDLENRRQSGQNYIDQLKLNSVHANPWLSMLAGVAGSYGKGAMLSGSTNGAGAATSAGDPWSGGSVPNMPLQGLGGNATPPWLSNIYG